MSEEHLCNGSCQSCQDAARLEAFKKLQQQLGGTAQPQPCPSCGHCPTCGRQAYQPNWQYYPPYYTATGTGTGTFTS